MGVSSATTFLVTYDFSVSLASRYGDALMLAGLIPVALLPRRRRRGLASAVVLVAALGLAEMGLTSCGGDSTGPNPPGGASRTFSVQFSGLTASGAAVNGVSVDGATVTVNK